MRSQHQRSPRPKVKSSPFSTASGQKGTAQTTNSNTQRRTLDLFLFFRPKVLSSTTWGRPAGSGVRPRASGHTGTYANTHQHHFRAILTLVLSAGLALAGAFFGGIPTGFGRSAVRAPRSHDGTVGRRLLDYKCRFVRERPRGFADTLAAERRDAAHAIFSESERGRAATGKWVACVARVPHARARNNASTLIPRISLKSL